MTERKTASEREKEGKEGGGREGGMKRKARGKEEKEGWREGEKDRQSEIFPRFEARSLPRSPVWQRLGTHESSELDQSPRSQDSNCHHPAMAADTCP